MKRIHHYTEAEARDFFERLASYSAEYVRIAIPRIHRHWPSKNFYDEWKFPVGSDGGHPIGSVLHYTAGVNFAGTVRHFTLGNRASAHVVVAKALDARFDDLRRSLGLEQLGAEVVQVVAPGFPSWHAGWMNRLCYGVEVRNAGILRPYLKQRGKPGRRQVSHLDFFRYHSEKFDIEDLDFYWWYDGWTAPFKGEVLAVNGSWWESWSRGSLATTVTVLRYLNSLYPGKMDPAYLIAHHHCHRGKSDVVLPLDLHKIREAVLYSNQHVDDLQWLTAFDDFEDGFEDWDDPYYLRESDDVQADRAEEDLDGFEVVEPKEPDLEEIEGLRKLGYHVVDSASLTKSLRIYQRSRGLQVTGTLTSKTQARLDRELTKWRI